MNQIKYLLRNNNPMTEEARKKRRGLMVTLVYLIGIALILFLPMKKEAPNS